MKTLVTQLPNEIPGFDLVDALERLANLESLLINVFSLFIEEYKEWNVKIDESIKNEDINLQKFLIHTIKGASANISATDLYRSILDVEQELLSGKSLLSSSKIENCKNQLQKSIDQLQKCLFPDN
jgi:HPt (histidine-containing phosphotransfer) domain-containing protein